MSDAVWAKVYLELPNDPKLIGRSAHDCYLWVCLILIAKPSDGLIRPWQAEAKYLSKYSRIPLKEVALALTFFGDVGMLRTTPDGGFLLAHFAKRQGRSDPTATERKRRQRDRDRDNRDSRDDVTRDSHHTRVREEADRNPNGLLAEAEADTPLSPSDDDGVCVSGLDLGVFGGDDRAVPKMPVLAATAPKTEAEATYATFQAQFRDGNDGHFGDTSLAGRAWFDHVTKPGHDPAIVLAALAGYFGSSDYADQRSRNVPRIGAAKWLAQWTDWKDRGSGGGGTQAEHDAQNAKAKELRMQFIREGRVKPEADRPEEMAALAEGQRQRAEAAA